MARVLQALSKSLVTLALLATAGGGYYWYQEVHAPCVSPISYKLGEFDSRFGVSKADFLSATREAESVWNKAFGKTLFVYDEKGSLPINLMYDTRQATTQKNQSLETNIALGKEVADSVKEQYSSLKAKYESDQNFYALLLATYNQQLDAYNQEVAYWNEKGGAPKDEFQKLSAKKAELAEARTVLENNRAIINAEATEINALIDQYNLVVGHVNETVGEINKNAGREFEEGEYISDMSGKRINIYEFHDRHKLVRVLAHELGHALGLQHNDNPESIMYYLNQSTNIKPSADDLADLKTLCKIK